ncbi:RNA polymerase sigma factor [Cellulomonas marina]|uniref:RNA polymerase sigma-70 factor, ECF subfamily n=1 Tax=Cellulomonas marina TaxID=988821 RepID=A0A1I0Y4N3_9CELL|nr:RNA polymerase sigma factor [Cellulomonas marina]GIG29790.1 hypothetical protein Cma02nite_23900 [Cellulomonas marina]SFB08162.1 RNA polymerase sigma-70 factor, ECF subfamily [Cellulomonas marina]
MRWLSTDPEAWFDALWREHAPRIQAYAVRHVGVHDAEDVLAETFTVAWRRRDEVPALVLPWLLVVARNTVANRRRTELRHDERVAALAAVAGPAGGADDGVEHHVAERAQLLGALALLSEADRPALLLTAWDGLGPAAAALVAGCSTTAFKVRLHRARARLQRLLDEADGDGVGAGAPVGAEDAVQRTPRGR